MFSYLKKRFIFELLVKFKVKQILQLMLYGLKNLFLTKLSTITNYKPKSSIESDLYG